MIDHQLRELFAVNEHDGKDNGIERNLGLQPLDAIMREHGLDNHDLVELRPADLSHKAVQRARKGRRLTPRMKLRITEVINAGLKQRGIERTYATRELFNYGFPKHAG